MMKETQRAIARNVAEHLILTFGREIEAPTYSEVLRDEIPGVDEDVFQSILKLTEGYVEVADVDVRFQDWRVKDDGSTIAPVEGNW